ncbi:hypothetical protein SPRG_00295 [Saprolegnia parasitica CBS 223.65]|uniref:L-2-hydroxyglutarate dehydrogenase, mitochondrial n=1 Tax=Saprolegnia parasitica (strain CBS 223.65) TaxID=695850 RepID=A0A067D8V8_SAPPC|nr:hypothetical protein SPRG_00295 [Saprolegnia parasitica CBS 223.65]KDO35447.1 hypothetical protein SPRG_00295 [Saprolegnia parasitica CBS 223.65]|eukprot:XP_012193787.1 hypothetical protein SPRG_00295 [Saprolegnia parasitica CBS 223.65]
MASSKLVAVIGSGAVGLAVARSAARRGLQVVVLEQHAAIGMECSSRNSEVIHAGLYYAPQSQKATLCVQGRQLMYDFCRDFHVPFQRCGKLVVASSADQMQQLQALMAKAMANGVTDVRLLTASDVHALEPDVVAHGALLSPSTGIVDSHALMLAMQGDAEAYGCDFALNCTVAGGRANADGTFDVVTHPTDDPSATDVITCDAVVNAAGLGALRLAALLEGTPRPFGIAEPTKFAKGSYFKLGGVARMPFQHLIYPVPEKGGLGVHATLDLDGNVRFGPDVEWVTDIDYQVNPDKAAAFAARIRDYWPGVMDAELIPDYSGIRPKIVGPGEPDADFRIVDGTRKELVHLLGIESPGLTSSLAIGEAVALRLAAL